MLAALAVGGVTVWSLTRPAPPPPSLVTRFPIPLAAGQAFTRGGRRLVAISPDSSHVVYQANTSLWLRPVDQLQAVQVPGTDQGREPFFSPGGQSIGFWAPDALKKVSVSGGVPVTIADVPANPFGASWGADDMILYGQPEGIMQVSGASGTPALLIPVGEGEVMYGPQMLPTGEWVLLTVRSAERSWDEAQIVAQSVTTSERTVLIDGGRDGHYLPTGHLVYALDNVLFAVPFDVDSREVTGGPVPLEEGVRGATVTGAMQFSVSTTGSLIYVPDDSVSTDRTLALVGRNGVVETLNMPPAPYQGPRLSPDRGKLVVQTAEADGGVLWLYDLAGDTQIQQLTFEGDNHASSSWWSIR